MCDCAGFSQRTQLDVTFSLDTTGSILATGVLTRTKHARTKQQIYAKIQSHRNTSYE